MKFKIVFLLVSLTIFSWYSKLSAQVITQSAEEILNERGEVYFRFDYPGKKALANLSKRLSIDKTDGNKVYAYANEKEFSGFLDNGLNYEIMLAPGLAHPVKMKTNVNIREISDWDFYPSYDAYLDMMYQFQEDYPELCEIVNYGQSIQGRDILFARISDNVSTQEGEAQFLYTATMHGDETAGYVLSLRLIDYLLSNYGSDPQIDNLVNNLDIWINPLANPDGTFYGGNSSVYGAIRYNANGVDLNRNYPDPEDGPHPDGNEWQAETLVFMQLAEDNHFVSSSNWHGGAEVFNYPWDTWPILAADDDWWQYVGHEFADTVHAYAPPSYLSGFNNGITNGYQWYSVNGGRQDYMNYFHQCREFIYEMSNVKLLPASQLPAHWEYNYRSFLNYMEQTLFGVQGVVTDVNTGEALYAEIYIDGHDLDSSWVYTNDFGKYYRLLHEGVYDITYSAEGYYPQTIENVTVVNRELTIVNAELEPGDLIIDFEASQTNIPVSTSIDFTDLTFGNPVSWEWTFEGGVPSSSNQQNPSGITYNEEGTYDVSLTVSDGSNTETITKENYIIVNLDFIIQNTTVTTCSGLFYDSGGGDGDYGNNEDFVMTFLPDGTDKSMIAEFLSFDVEFEPNCNYDWLRIYDGNSTSASMIGEFCGTNSPGTVAATNDEGALTFEFHSDGSVTGTGWIAQMSCESVVVPPVADFIADQTSILEGGTVAFTDLSLNNPVEWEWQFDGGDPAQSSEQNPEITYTTPGIYNVTLTVTNSAGSNTLEKEDYITVEETVGVTVPQDDAIKLYPNPVRHKIKISSPVDIIEVVIFNSYGETAGIFLPGSNFCVINVSNLAPGIYFARINTVNGTVHKKFEIN